MTRTLRHLLSIILLALSLTTVAYAERLPRPDHVVVVIEENRGYAQIMDPLRSDSYIHALAKRGMLFTQSYGVAHP
ncbi:MAG: acid phosphatase, partial [Nitrosomonadales bacterium]|nr:acid phosphatase [Nitrosomonadales bacterium]